MRENFVRGFGLAAAAALFCTSAANAQYYEGFEGLNGSPGGTLTTGQGGFYLPVAGSTDNNIFTYAGNTLGIPQNPVGGQQFNSGTSNGGFGRAQLDFDFAAGSVVVFSFDFLGTIDPSAGAGGAAFLGSMSLRDTSTVNHLLDWHDRLNPTDFFMEYRGFDAAGAAVTIVPGPEWEHFERNHWYRAYTTMDLSTNMITEVSIVDLSNGQGATFAPVDFFLSGGAAGAGGAATGYRMFTGGDDGNTTGWDNVSITPAPGALALLGLGGLVAMRRRR